MNKTVIVVWLLCMALAVSHLMYLAAYDYKPGFWIFTMGLLACYSLPLFVLTRIRIPEKRFPMRYMTLALFILVCTVSLVTPLLRFMPRYHPSALESLIYIFVPMMELGPIVLFFIVREVVLTRESR